MTTPKADTLRAAMMKINKEIDASTFDATVNAMLERLTIQQIRTLVKELAIEGAVMTTLCDEKEKTLNAMSEAFSELMK